MLGEITDRLIEALDGLRFSEPVTHVYNPLVYARAPWDRYCELYGQKTPREVLMLGMNPGPFGMAQVGVPFGEIALVRDWIGVEAPVGKPPVENPKRPIVGFECKRSEVSGKRLWGWAASRFGTAERFFDRFFVANYCPLVFMEEGGRNFIPEKLPKSEREPLFEACDQALRQTIEFLDPDVIVGVGKFAEKKAKQVCDGLDVTIGSMPHPSPASPIANKGWEPLADKALKELGISL